MYPGRRSHAEGTTHKGEYRHEEGYTQKGTTHRRYATKGTTPSGPDTEKDTREKG